MTDGKDTSKTTMPRGRLSPHADAADAPQAGRSPRDDLIARFVQVRELTERLSASLSAEDQVLQSMPLCSPAKWHRAHTTWFFEAFLLGPAGFEALDPRYAHLFNSYYESLGARVARPLRGMLSRPATEEVTAYRRRVEGRVIELLSSASEHRVSEWTPIVELGLAHEQQHQELLLTDIQNAFSLNPIEPPFSGGEATDTGGDGSLRFVELGGGLLDFGASAQEFAFDNERPRHKRWIEPFALADRLITVGEVRAFIQAGGYRTPMLWLSDGWDWVQRNAITAPLYARLDGERYTVFGLHGRRTAHDDEPALHLSYYEADAIARFMNARLPTEFEWECAARSVPLAGNFLDPDRLVPRGAPPPGDGPRQLWGDAWEWTQSAYAPYPGFSPEAGAIGEYNGKFMVGQMVLRGGSYLTPAGHVRPSYRNFWHPDTRFQATGARLARSITREEGRTR